ncbi:MAG: T9SS type A sorting domain-containing protein [Bacteroidales bacterium]|nr:T9SS type A sorting domain-containing protein [Bacteroidales bacterium]MCF8391755.1 T9SS type A sorting domain-containing protein [Bacteroidales bacterium]
MKKIILSIALLFAIIAGYSQGLENLIVEKYYTASAADAALEGGVLTNGAVTYRIFIDMAPGYKLTAVFGIVPNPLYIETTTGFYNNDDRGDAIANSIGDSRVADNTVSLDSWISLGATSAGRIGVLKTEDSDGSILGHLTNTGVGTTNLVAADGLTAATPAGVSTIPALTATTVNAFFGNGSGLTGPRFEINDGSWYTFGGTYGDAVNNRVLVAQITTDGDLTFDLNVQLLDAGGVAENYVAQPNADPVLYVQSDLLHFSTINLAPSVSLDPLAVSAFFEGETVNATAQASDPDGSVAQVEFFIDAVSAGIDASAPYELSAPVGGVGAHVISARVTDNFGLTANAPSTLTYTVATNATPTAAISAPADLSSFDLNAGPVTVSATANDAEGDAITQVEFFVDAASIGVDATAPYSVVWTPAAAGDYVLTAVASDASREGAASADVHINIYDANTYYTLGAQDTISVPCYDANTFCVPLNRVNYDLANVTGFDMVMTFDASKVVPTGVVSINAELHTGSRTDASYTWRVDGDSLFVSVFMSGNGGANFVWEGRGEILCVEFVKTYGFSSADKVDFSVSSLRESYLLSNTLVDETLINTYTYVTYIDYIFNAQLNFWADGSPIQGTEANGYNSARMMGNLAGYYAEPDANGQVSYNWNLGGTTNLVIEKQIENVVYDEDLILSLFGGQDALLTQKVLVNDPTFIPSAYQIIAMDVNKDGKVTAGDVSQINQRAVQIRQEFANGTGMDWEYVALSDYISEERYQISTNYPYSDGSGYSKEFVPNPEKYQGLSGLAADVCPVSPTETFIMILLGDVDGSYNKLVGGADSRLKSAKVGPSVTFDLSNAIYEENFVDVPVMISSVEAVNALDFALMLNTDKLQFMSVTNKQKVEALSNSIEENVWNTSYSLENYNTEEPVFSVRFLNTGGQFSNDDFTYASAFINGTKVDVNFTKSASNATGIKDNDFAVNVYPNPANDMFVVEVSAESSVQLIDMNGRVLRTIDHVSDKTQMNVNDLSSGIYMVKITSENSSLVKRIVINK